VPTEVSKEIELEIAYVLFIDIVGYSKLVSHEQRRLLELLNHIVREAEHFRTAEAKSRLITVPTGDGMALVFYNTPEAPVQCALEISSAATEHPDLMLRMGIHSGPVSGVVDVSGRANIAGAGINIAQRVMDCGDAGHVLVSKHMAEDLEQYGHWKRNLHDLGECEVKHGVCVAVVNLYTEDLGNPEVPQKFRQTRKGATPLFEKKRSRAWIFAVGLVLVTAVIAGLVLLSRRSAPVTTDRQAIQSSTATEGPPGGASAPAPEKSVAVLPFDNLSDEKQNAFFTDGVQDEILTDLAKIADLKVISRSSVMQYRSGVARDLRKIGQELGVAHLLEGSVQRAANRVRVNAQLIDARNDAHLWAQTYDRDLADVFAIQSEIAKAIADQLQAKLSPSEINAIERAPTADVTAFDLYTQAKTLLLNTSFSAKGLSNMLQAVDLLNRAIARDPSFFQAYCVLASAHDSIYFLGNEHTPARLAAAEAAIESASRMRPDAGETHLARAENLYRGYYDYDGALAELDIARRTLPNDSRIPELAGYIVRRRGKQEEGLQYLLRSLELDPRNFLLLQQTALSYQILRKYPEMARVLDRGLAIKPDDVETRAARAVVELDWKSDTHPVHQLMEELRARDPAALKRVADTWFTCALAERDPVAAEAAISALGENPYDYNQGAVYFNRSILNGLNARMMNDEAKARAAFTAARPEQETVVHAQPHHGPALCVLGLIDAALGRKDEALSEARRAVELLPVEKDAFNGPQMIEMLAMAAAWLGEKDLACQQLSIEMRLPGGVSYGQLKLMPYWDPLRGDPRFEKIVASLAPKL
jgi:TolB-like protein/class 3 adenylate cyclase/Flp pilus assembly protein TadD